MKLATCKPYFLAIFLISSGCTIRYVASESPIEPDKIPPFKVAGPVKVVNAQESFEDMPVFIPGFTLSLNYRHYTDLALKLLKRELDKRIVAGGAPKEIKLAVVDIKMIPMPGTIRCIINYTAEAGDGYVRGIEVIGASWNYRVAIDTAVTNVAIGVLNDEGILDYLEK